MATGCVLQDGDAGLSDPVGGSSCKINWGRAWFGPVGGGILRDMIMGLPVAIMHVGSLYAVAAGVGCLVLATTAAFGVDLILAASIGIVVTAVIRLLAVIFDISLPEQRALYRRKVAVETSAIPTVKP